MGLVLSEMMSTEANEIDLDRRTEIAGEQLLHDGELAEELDETELRDLLGAVVRELFSGRRPWDTTPQEHVQTCYVFAREAIAAAARPVIERRTTV